MEGWPEILTWCIDSNPPEYVILPLFIFVKGPVKNNYMGIAYFIISFILVGSFFLLNLFVGVIFYHFLKAHKTETQSSVLLTDEQCTSFVYLKK